MINQASLLFSAPAHTGTWVAKNNFA